MKKSDGKRIEIWSFFSGAMGLDLGLEEAGLRPTLANEINRYCCETIRRNRPGVTLIEEDISKLSAARLRQTRRFDGDVELMLGGPPCQSFSSGGKRSALSDPRGNLIYEYLRLVKEVRPRFFLFENVANLATAALEHRPIAERPGQHWSLKRYSTDWQNGEEGKLPLSEQELSGSAIRKLLGVISGLKYKVSLGIIDAADYGAPQHRLRFVMLGSRDGSAPTLPPPKHGPEGSGLLPFATVRDAIWHLRRAPGPGSQYTEEVRKYFALVPPGGNWRSLPERLRREALGGSFHAGGGKTGFYRRLSWEKPAPTITGRANRKGSALCHPDQDRPLSVRECAALQGFPAEWVFTGAMNNQYLQIGNAVPIHLGRALGDALAERRATKRVSPAPDLHDMLAAAVARLRAAARNKRPAAATVGA